MKQTLSVEINTDIQKSYEISISDTSFEKLLDEINVFTRGKKRLFVISKKVYHLYCSKWNLSKKEILILKDGEKEKNLKTYAKIIEKMLSLGLTRKDVVIAIGGGVVGDIVGFAASSYMRGIDFIQVPTTLLAMVDSSVGGKTAVDFCGVKNIIGAFHQPKAVFININFLKTLSKKDFSSGLGEVIKYAFIEDNCKYKHPLFLFEYLTLSRDKVFEKDSMTLMRLIEYCLLLKIAVVNEDEKEAGLRKILNLGHTLGHALESITHYKKFTHGEAVAQGLFFIFDWAYSKGLISYSYYRLSTELLNKYGFKAIKFSEKFNIENLTKIMTKDKKSEQNYVNFIVPCDKKRVKEISYNQDEILDMF